MTVIFVTKKDMKERPMKEKLANHLERAKKGYIKRPGYMTRDMVADRKITATAKRIAEEKGIDLDAVEGTGVDGKITKADVEKAAE